jgi:cytochrome o ubiquinol oxidase subunit 2
MNSFYVPALAGQIYAMPGMETKLHAVVNEAGSYRGFSANYSGAGFSGMHFAFHGLPPERFERWIAAAKAEPGKLDKREYLELERPGENAQVRRYGSVDPALYDAIVNRCVEPGRMCMNEMMAIDAKGGLGLAGVGIALPLLHGEQTRRGAVFGVKPFYIPSICTTEELASLPRSGGTASRPRNFSSVRGAGLRTPFFSGRAGLSPPRKGSLPASDS